MIIALLLLSVLAPAFGQFYLTVVPDSTTTNVATNYTFSITTSFSIVPAGTSVRVTFPAQYTTAPTSPSCTNVYWIGAPSTLACAYGANILTISDGFPSELSDQFNFQFKVGSILNPLPAGTTSTFIVSFVYPNSTVVTSTGTYTTTITEGPATCSKTITNGLVSAMGVISVTFTPKNVISNGSTVFLSVAMNRTYTGDASNSDITASIAGSTVVGTYRFNFTMTSPFNINMLMPFSTQPVSNFITITSYISAGNIDTCQLTIDGISANTFVAMTVSSGRVQATSTVSFNFINLSPILVSDQLVVTFPTEFNISGIGSTVTMLRGTVGIRNITIANNVVTIWNVTTTTMIRTNTTFAFSNVVLPFSTRSTQITMNSQTNTGFLKDLSTITYTANMGTLSSLSVTCDINQLGYSTTCTFFLTLQSSLTSSGSISFSFPADFSISGGNYQCLTTGTDNIRSNCTNYVSNNSILVSNMTAGTLAANSVMTVRLNLTLPATPTTYSVNISTWCPGIVDSGIASLTVVSRQLLSSEFTVSSSSQVTYSTTIYGFGLTLPVTASLPLTALITMAVDSQGVLSCTNGTVLSSYNKPVLSLSLPSPVVPLNVSGLLTPYSTSPISVSLQIVSSTNVVYYYISGLKLQVTTPRDFQYLASTQTSTMVYDNTNMTVTLSGLQANTIVTITGATYNGTCEAGSNITTIVCTGITNGVQANITTDGLDSSDSRRYSFSVAMVNPAHIGSQQLQVNSLTSDNLYLISTGTLSIYANTVNSLTINFTQSNPYFRQNSTYTITVNGTTPNSSYLNITIPVAYTFVSASGLSSSTFIQAEGNILMFSIDSYLNIKLQIQLTNPDDYSSIYLKTYSNKGDIDSGTFLPTNPCSGNCRSCNADTTTCTSCYSWSSYNKLNSGSCLSSCPDAKYFNGSSCLQCMSNCNNCSSAVNCFGCDTGFILFNNSCLTSCPNGYYVSGSSCQACSSACLTCSELTNCTVCSTGYSLFNNTCLSQCPGATYSLNKVCYNCSTGCLSCTALACTQCNTSMLLYNGNCMNACPDGLFVDASRNCVNCQSPCATCVNTSTTCLSCVSERYLMVHACNATCPDTYYINLAEGVCSQCVSPCLTCSSESVCLSCVPGQYFYQNTCSTTCPSGSYASSTSNCTACVSPCQTCTSATACTTCSSNLILFNLTCIVTCPSEFYNSSGVCAACVSPCLTCQSNTICLSCVTGSLFNRSCVAVCPLTHYSSNGVCVNCISPCMNCEGSGTTCIACVTGYILHGSTCVTSCPDKFYSLDGICNPCIFPCLTCTSATTCLSCDKNSSYPYFAASQSSCVDVCSGGLHLNPTAMICQPCQHPCTSCLQSKQCLTCSSGYILNGTSCISSCPAGYYNLSSNCVSCPQYCTTCQLRDSVVCLDCQADTYFFGNYCVAGCPQNTTLKYGYCISDSCQQSNCIRCSNQNCLECSAYYTLADNTCTLNLSPNDYVESIKQSNIVPFPFLGGAILVIIVMAAVRFQFSSMYLPISLYAWIGLLEAGALILWGSFTISTYKFESYGLLAIAILGLYFLSNVANLMCYSMAIKPDRKYKIWLCDHQCGNTLIMTISTILSFRFSRVQFSKLGNWQIFHARICSLSAYLPYNILTGLSMLYICVLAIIVCGMVSYQQTTMNQIFFSSIEVVLLEVMLLFVSLAEMIKPKGYLLENAADYAHGNEIDSVKIESMKCIHQELNSGAEIDDKQVPAIGAGVNEDGSEDIEFQQEEPEDLQAGNPADSSALQLTGQKLLQRTGERDRKSDVAEVSEEENATQLRTRPTSPLHVTVPNDCIFTTPIDQLQAEKDELEDKLKREMELTKQELEAQLAYEEVRRQHEQEMRREQQEKDQITRRQQEEFQQAMRRQQQEIEQAKRRTQTEQARIQQYEQLLRQKEEQERELKAKLKKLQDEQQQQRRNALKQHREWQMMDIEDHLSREREFRDRIQSQIKQSGEEVKEQRMEEIRKLADLKMELYRTEEKKHTKSIAKKKKKHPEEDIANKVMLHNGSVSDLSDKSNNKSKKQLKGKEEQAGTQSNEQFIVQFDQKDPTNSSQKITRVSELNRVGSRLRNLKTIQQEQLRLREEDPRYNRKKIHAMVDEAQRRMNNYLSSMADHNDYQTIGSQDLPRQIKHDASMPLPTGKLELKSSRSYVGKSMETQQITVGPIAQEDEGRYALDADMSEALVPSSLNVDDPRSSIHHMTSRRKNIPMGAVSVKVRSRQQQLLRTSEKDLQTERIYLQRLSVERSPQRSSRIFEAVGRDSLRLSPRRNTSLDWSQRKESQRYRDES